MDALLDRLKALGVELGKEKTSYKQRLRVDLAQELGGIWKDTPFGQTLFIHQEFSQSTFQGEIPLFCKKIDQKILELLDFGRNISSNSILPNDICFFDTETSSLNLGSGAFVFLTGFSYFGEDGNLNVDQFFMPHPSQEKAFIFAVQEYIGKFKVLSSYNGKSFDVPMLHNRYVMMDLEDDSLDKAHLDLLFLARSLWKRRLDSCRLADIEKNILHFERSSTEVPSWLVPILYQDFLRDGNPLPLQGVLYHNAQDVISLAALFNVIQNLFSEEGPQKAIEVEDLLSLAYFYRNKGYVDRSIQCFNQYFDQCGEEYDCNVLYDYAWVHRRMGNWQEAVKYWSIAAENNHHSSMIELTKYYEHQQKDIKQALHWLEKVEQEKITPLQ